MNFFQLYYKHLLVNKQTKGFTLTELLAAIAISGLVLAGLGTGMMAILNNSRDSTAETEVKNQLNRAIDYIQDDIARSRLAGITTTDPLNPNDTIVLTYFTSENSTVPNTIRYYLSDVGSPSPWLGPKVLRRQVNSGAWQVLVDGITENNVAGDFACNSADPLITRSDTTDGFQFCIEQAIAPNATNVYRVSVGLFGEILDVDGTDGASDLLSVYVDTIARSITPTVEPPRITFTPATDISPLLTWNTVLGADSYQIFRCNTTEITCTPDTPEGVNITATSYQTADPPNNERACFHGVSVNTGSSSPAGNVVCTIINPSSVPPNIVDSDFIVSPDISPTVSWTKDSTTVDYHLYRCSTNDPNNPCTITVENPALDDERVAQFTAPTNTAFDANVPWTETETPAVGQAFCYGVVAENEEGYSIGTLPSNIPVVKCGALNATEFVDPLWDIQFINFDTSSTRPQGITWTDAGDDATKYIIVRCEGDDCNPETEGSEVLNGKPASLVFNEDVVEPGPGNQFCYQVRAIGTGGRVSPFSDKECGEKIPGLCTLNLAQLGAGITPTTLPGFPFGATILPYVRDANELGTVIDIVTVEGRFTNSPNPIPQSIGPGFDLILQVLVDGAPVAPADSIEISCDSQITFVGQFPAEFIGVGSGGLIFTGL